MKFRYAAGLTSSLLIAPCLVTFVAMGAENSPAVDFVRDVQPVFQRRCAACHGSAQHLAGLRLDDRESVSRVIQAGHSRDSRLIQMVTGASGKIMPPVGAKLTDEQVTLLSRWIDPGRSQVAASREYIPALGMAAHQPSESAGGAERFVAR